MKLRLWIPLIVVGFFIQTLVAADLAAPAASPAVAASQVLHRVIGDRARDFSFDIIPAENGLDVYEVEASGGKVSVRGDTAVAMCRGAYDYLREKCHCMFCWEGEHMDLPARFPDVSEHRVVSPYKLREYYNVCTLGYTTPYWDWHQWQHELDWMALHGINMPLAEVATEAIWQKVWLSMGITQAELDKYFTGPAYFPWHRMGNIQRWDGPPPADFFPKRIELQKKIIARMRELGMQPIAPAFAGFVPKAIQRVYPGTKVATLSDWGHFPPQMQTQMHLLDPTSPLFSEIGKRFVRQWEKEFGRNKYFLADSFNEMTVPVPPDRAGRLATLAKYGNAVYQSIIAGEPDATWVMQGWIFYNKASFWDKDSVAALLSKIPDDRMIILDLACDFRPIWRSQNAFDGKEWIYSVIHNMGGKTTVGGNLNFFATDPARTLAAPNHGHLVGFGLGAEGMENNEVVYELLTDAMWTGKPIDLATWVPAYCAARYGACPPDMKRAWQLLCESCYGNEVAHTRPGYVHRPDIDPSKWGNVPNDSPQFLDGLKLFLKCSPEFGKNVLYRADALDMTAQYLGSRIDSLLKAALAANRAGKPADRDHCAAEALDLMSDVDALLANHPINRLGRWVHFARSWGDTPAESDYYESDAKRLITTWGGPRLTEYASRVWSGLVGSYYRARWAGYFHQLETGQKFHVLSWEEHWIRTPFHSTVRKAKHPMAMCKRLIAKAEMEK